jgi:hypothetical protein
MTRYLLNTVSQHFRDIGITPLRTKHRVIQLILGPIQFKVFLHKRRAISVNRVYVSYCLSLSRSGGNQPVDLVCARSIQERPKHILAIAKKILRAPANNYAGSSRKCVLYRRLRYNRDSPRATMILSEET